MGHTSDLLTGLAQYLAAAGIGATYKDSGQYADSETGIVFDVVPAAPDSVIVLSGYSVDDDPIYGNTVDGVQIRTRTGSLDPRPTNDLADAIFDALQGASLTLNGIRVLLARRTSWTPLGADSNRRHERSDNYYLDTNRPSTHRQ